MPRLDTVDQATGLPVRKPYETQKNIEKEEEIIVGLNKFTLDEEVDPDLLKVDETLEKEQITAINNIRKERNQADVNQALEALKENAERPDSNLIPYILDAVKAYATIGEICNIMREEFGEYTGI
jgi:methylmalonyl-CoA mutase N-terminal domain/subunit